MLSYTLPLLTLLAAADPAPVTADIILKGGTVYDGSGRPGVVADVAIKGDRIVAVGTFNVAGKPKVIDAPAWSSPPGSSTCTPTPTTAPFKPPDAAQPFVPHSRRDHGRHGQLRFWPD